MDVAEAACTATSALLSFLLLSGDLLIARRIILYFLYPNILDSRFLTLRAFILIRPQLLKESLENALHRQ